MTISNVLLYTVEEKERKLTFIESYLVPGVKILYVCYLVLEKFLKC